MATPSKSSGGQYHYSENGVSLGPYSAEQLKGLATAGKIGPQTLIWKEGLPNWVPASALKGLFATTAVTARPQPAPVPAPAQPPPMPVFDNGPPGAAKARTGLLIGIIAGATALVAVLVVVVILLAGGDKKSDFPTGGDKKSDFPTKDSQVKDGDTPPRKKPTPPAPKPPPQPPLEISARDLLARYQRDSAKTLADLKDKPITLKVEGTWNVDQLEKNIDPRDGNLKIRYYQGVVNPAFAGPFQAIYLFFPVSEKNAKLGFFAKIREYAEKRTKGEHVVMSITGTLSTFVDRNQTYLLVKDGVLN